MQPAMPEPRNKSKGDIIEDAASAGSILKVSKPERLVASVNTRLLSEIGPKFAPTKPEVATRCVKLIAINTRPAAAGLTRFLPVPPNSI